MRRLVVVVLALVTLPGCPLCDLDGELDVVRGSSRLHAGERVSLELDSEGYEAGPDRCRGHWYVDDFEGGNAEVGIITRCGEYISTLWPRPRPFTVVVTATQYPLDGCADCCPYQTIQLEISDP
jgi:hypothetical protein